MNQANSKIPFSVHEQIVLFEFRPTGNYAEEVSAGLHNSLSPGSKTMKRSPELFSQIDPDSQRFMKYSG